MRNVCVVNWGNKYSPTYTRRVRKMVENHSSEPFNFYVLTDNPTLYDKYRDINAIEIDTDDTAWWCKMFMFKKGVLPPGDYLYLDLDVVIVDNIDCFFEHSGFGITRDFIRPDNGILPGKEYNSSILRFNNTTTHGIYEYYMQNKKMWLNCQKQVHFFGDQNVISAYVNYYPEYLNVFPDEWCWSLRKGIKRGATAGDRSEWFGREIPKGSKICVFHGNPNPDELLSDKGYHNDKMASETCRSWVKRLYADIL